MRMTKRHTYGVWDINTGEPHTTEHCLRTDSSVERSRDSYSPFRCDLSPIRGPLWGDLHRLVEMQGARIEFLRQYGLLRRWTTDMKDTGCLDDITGISVFETVVTRHGRKKQWRDFERGYKAGFNAGRENPPRYSELTSLDDHVDFNTSYETVSARDADPIPPLIKRRVPPAHKKITKRQLDAIEAMRLLRQDGRTPPRKLRPKPERAYNE